MNNVEALRARLERRVLAGRPVHAGGCVRELVEACCEWATTAFPRRRGTNQHVNIRHSTRELVELYGDRPAEAIGPTELQVCRELMVERDIVRGVINRRISQVRYVYQWGIDHGWVSGRVLAELRSVRGLKPYRSAARESREVQPVPVELVERTLPQLTPMVQAMVLFCLYSGARPGEVVVMTKAEIETDGPTWVYVPGKHKTVHLEKRRRIHLGPKAVDAMLPFFNGNAGGYIFTTRLGGAMKVTSFAQHIRLAARKAGVPHWSPNQLRHTRGTEARRAGGLEESQAVLGHAKIETTQIYAQRQEELAIRAALRDG